MTQEKETLRKRREAFIDGNEENAVHHMLSPLPMGIVLIAVLLICGGLGIMTAIKYGIIYKNALITYQYLAAAHTMRGIGECVIMSCLLWGLAVWDYCPRRVFLLAIIATGMYHAIAVVAYLTGLSGTSQMLLNYAYPLYSIIALVLSVNILLTFDGTIWRIFCMYAIMLLTGLVIKYTDSFETLMYVTNKISAVAFAVYSYHCLKH
jgi:hypothetical protein